MNTNSLYKDLTWNLFEKTGDVSVFLEYKQFEMIDKGENNEYDTHERVSN